MQRVGDQPAGEGFLTAEQQRRYCQVSGTHRGLSGPNQLPMRSAPGRDSLRRSRNLGSRCHRWTFGVAQSPRRGDSTNAADAGFVGENHGMDPVA